MKRTLFHLLAILAFLCVSVVASATMGRAKTDANLFGHVTVDGVHLPGVSIQVKGTAIGTATDRTGHYRLLNLPEGNITLVVSSLGYRTITREVTMVKGETQEINFELQEDLMHVDAVVVTGDKNALKRSESSVIVNTVSPKMLAYLNATTISEGLPFVPGARMENNCQNCGFNQVRLNGMEGEYSQILVDGHPIFSGLMSVYGMELIPANMIERLEVQRGGGSALYGSNAIAGTVNIILRDPMLNAFEASISNNFTGVGLKGSGGVKNDWSVAFNSSNVSDDNRAGLSLYGNHRSRAPFDANGDGFSELPKLDNTTIGTRAFYRLGNRGKLSATYFHINEMRRGGNSFELPDHEADVSESPKHRINSASLLYTQLFRSHDMLSVNTSMQHIDRASYYGGNGLKDYGRTNNITFNTGIQYNANFTHSALITGVDLTGERLHDRKPAYTDIENAPIKDGEVDMEHLAKVPTLDVAKQETMTAGLFTQYSITWGIAKITLGGRLDHYQVTNRLSTDAPAKAWVPVPRAGVLFSFLPELQMRLNYSMGYRAPQTYNEELHVEASGARRIIQRLAPGLKRETSHSAMISLDYNAQFDHIGVGLLAEGFYTRLSDAFINKRHEEDEDGIVLFERMNSAKGAQIYGANIEASLAHGSNLTFKCGGTYQKSYYLEANEDLNFGQKNFLRTPNLYGFFLTDWKFYRGFTLTGSLNLTGSMEVPYEGSEARDAEEAAMIEENEFSIRKTPAFADLGLKLNYSFNLKSANISVFGGVKNVFNSYQRDFDSGPDRASSYVYGPMSPRTVYIGVKMGSLY